MPVAAYGIGFGGVFAYMGLKFLSSSREYPAHAKLKAA
jgi:hypothetical protein